MHSTHDHTRPETKNTYCHTEAGVVHDVTLNADGSLTVKKYNAAGSEATAVDLPASQHSYFQALIGLCGERLHDDDNNECKTSGHLPHPGDSRYSALVQLQKANAPTLESAQARVSELEAELARLKGDTKA